MFGFLNVAKPGGMTSHDVVAAIRRALRQQGRGHVKVGHAGTLDPMATGVLVLCLGQATRLSEYVMSHTKRYKARILFGVETDTYDADGTVTARSAADYLTVDQVAAAAQTLLGDIEQLPPMYSAIKIAGKKLYDLARAGHTVERDRRPVRIERIELLNFSVVAGEGDRPGTAEAEADIVCSTGTYIRSIAHDLGQHLSTGAHLTALERTASGVFATESAVPLERLLAESDWNQYLVAPLTALPDMSRTALSDADWAQISHGRTIAGDAPDGTVSLGVYGDRLAAVLQAKAGAWLPYKVFLHAEAG